MATKKKAAGTKKSSGSAAPKKLKDLKARKNVVGGKVYSQPPDPD